MKRTDGRPPRPTEYSVQRSTTVVTLRDIENACSGLETRGCSVVAAGGLAALRVLLLGPDELGPAVMERVSSIA